MKIYHNPRCSKSRQTLALIRAAGVEPEIVDYLNEPPSVEELDELLKKLRLEPRDIMRKGEAEYKDLKLKDRELGRDEALRILAEHPRLLERPIVVEGRNAVLGRPPENVKKLL
ncbi:MAG TPA: arsenate reductase (glutaredoxin) [Planctomycetaceae bacterium]|nr:arsenate reductase (glutaredoxin) [Planctomycetaceae bacterium]